MNNEAKPIKAGFFKYPNSDKAHQSNTFYDANGISPTLDTCTGGNRQVKIIEATAAAMRGRYIENGQVEQQIEVSDRDYANAITTVQKDSLIAEPNVLTPKRTEYGKAIRKAYEAGEIQESRHNMTELQPRTDGISNTLTTVLKDNYVAEPSFINGDICKTVRAGGHGSTDRHSWDMVECNTSLRIRKLTPLECWRLQGFDDEDFYKAEKVCSNTQLYKQAGNSITVDVLEYLFKEIMEALK